MPDFNQVAPTDVIGAYEAFEQRRREREVKLAHLQYIEDKLEKCSLFNGVHNVFQECRHLIAEYEQTKNELMGWKEGSPVCLNILCLLIN